MVAVRQLFFVWYSFIYFHHQYSWFHHVDKLESVLSLSSLTFALLFSFLYIYHFPFVFLLAGIQVFGMLIISVWKYAQEEFFFFLKKYIFSIIIFLKTAPMPFLRFLLFLFLYFKGISVTFFCFDEGFSYVGCEWESSGSGKKFGIYRQN